MSQLSDPSIDFGFKFLRTISSESDSKNVLLSPLSVIIAYCMVLEGAAGETEEQIKDVLNLDKIDSQNGSILEIVTQLIKKLENKDNDDGQRSILELSNLLMANSDFKLKETFVQSLLTKYSAKAFNEDFRNGKYILEKVNSWVSEKTKSVISTILDRPPELCDVCLLVSTIYFEDRWLYPFNAAYTKDKIFKNSDGTTIETKMMTLPGKTFNFLESAGKKLKIVEIPYVGKTSMILLLPTDDNNLKKMISNLSSTELSSLIDSMTMTRLNTLTIPKFKLEDKHELHEILPKIGMTLPFRNTAQFPKITEGSLPLYISQSIQKALIEVTETGTVATAATSIAASRGLAFNKFSDRIIEFVADQPFLYLIRDNSSRVILFIGQLNNMKL